jgi:Secretory lipase
LSRGSAALVVLALAGVVELVTPSAAEQPIGQTTNALQTQRSDSRHTLPLSPFYDTPIPLPAGKPGDLIRAEPFDEYALPYDVSAVRFLYHSRAATGEDVASSGVILVPEGKPPAGGWPIIAWAHRFSGVARTCAPSLMRNLYVGPFLSMYVGLGYAVVATDYAGLGTNFRNAFLDLRSNAMDVIYSVAAARAAIPQLGSRWIAMGESQGGPAVVGVAEIQSEMRDPSYLGAIAISGVAGIKDIYEALAQEHSRGLPLFVAYGIKTVYPRFQVSNMLTDKALPLYEQIERQCGVSDSASELSTGEMLKKDWENEPFVKQFFSVNTLGQKPAYGPLLIIGAEDPEMPIPLTARVVARMCKQGDRIQFYKYPESGSLLGDSVADQITWIQSRFAGRPAPSNCP